MADTQPIQVPLTTIEDDSRYLLHTPAEIAFILRDLVMQRAMVTAYFNQGKHFILTTLLAVNQDALVFDYGSSKEMNERMLATDKIIFITIQHGIKYQFSTGKPKRVLYKGVEAFMVALPQQLLRLQRREYYRVEIPLRSPLHCRIPGQELQRLYDLSLGGLCLIADKKFAKSRILDRFAGCSVDVGRFGMLNVELEVRRVTPVGTKRGTEIVHVGCQFVDIHASQQVTIQRYIAQLEKDKRARFED
jgi:c-di-GMP-binding flagellar brake protein YcgR